MSEDSALNLSFQAIEKNIVFTSTPKNNHVIRNISSEINLSLSDHEEGDHQIGQFKKVPVRKALFSSSDSDSDSVVLEDEKNNKVLVRDSFDQANVEMLSNDSFNKSGVMSQSSFDGTDHNVTIRTNKTTIKTAILDLNYSMSAMSIANDSGREESSSKSYRNEYDRDKDRSRSLLYSNSSSEEKIKRSKKEVMLRKAVNQSMKLKFNHRVAIESSDESISEKSRPSTSGKNSTANSAGKDPSRRMKIESSYEDDFLNDKESSKMSIQDNSARENVNKENNLGNNKVDKQQSEDSENENVLSINEDSDVSDKKDKISIDEHSYKSGDDNKQPEVYTIDSSSDTSLVLNKKKSAKETDYEDDVQVLSNESRSGRSSSGDSSDKNSSSETPSSRENSSDDDDDDENLFNKLDKLNAQQVKAAANGNEVAVLELTKKISSIENKINLRMNDDNDIQFIKSTYKKNKPLKGPLLVSPPKQNPELAIQDGKRLFGGRMSLERIEIIETVTQDTIKTIHESVNAAPENTPTPTPEGIKVELMPHQEDGLTWLLWRETQHPPCGILADDMGLGKTLSMISLILHQKNDRLKGNKPDAQTTKRNRDLESLVQSNCTLVIAPASLVLQWENEIRKFVKPGRLSVEVYHGQKREDNARTLARNDIVLTTYGTVSSELTEKNIIGADDSNDGGKKRRKQWRANKGSVLAKIAWDRVILDEAHQIKNRTANVAKACFTISARKRWCLTGTPIHNKLWDLYSLIRFMRVVPFSEEKIWQEYIMNVNKGNNQRLHTLVKGLLLRRTKDQLCARTQKPIVDLKPRNFQKVQVTMDGIEFKCYEQMMAASRQQAKIILDMMNDEYPGHRKNKNRDAPIRNPFLGGVRELEANDQFQAMNCILLLLLRLRQAAVHMALTKEALDLDAFRDDGIDETEIDDALMDQLNKTLENIDLKDNDKDAIDKLFSNTYLTAKIKAVLNSLDEVLQAGDKCVIVSQWTSVLDIIEQHIIKKNIKYTSINGKIPTKDRQPRVNDFNDGTSKVMLLSLTAGGVGLNLVGGNHLFLVDLHWNPALESQACDRIYRIGQTKNVFIYKFICVNTIESRVLQVQEEKMEMAHGVLEGVKRTTKLSRNEIEFLFDLKPQRHPVKPMICPPNI